MDSLFYYLKNSSGTFLSSNGNLLRRKLKLPAAYQEVEYITFNGSQYINTGQTVDSTMEVEFTMYPTTTGKWMFGVRSTGGATNTFGLYINNATQYWAQIGGNSSSTGGYVTVTSTTTKLSQKITGTKWYIEDVLKTSYANKLTAYTNYNLYIGTMLQAGSVDGRNFVGNLYSFKIYKSGELVSYFVPCYRKSDSVIGLYDVIQKTFKTNVGSGTFTKGSDRGLSSDYIECEYIESSGSQGLDTGIAAANKLFDIDLQFTSNASRQLMGISGSASEYWGNNKGTWEKLGNSEGTTTLDRVLVHYDVGNLAVEKVTTWINNSTSKYTGGSSNWSTASAQNMRIFKLASSGYNCSMKLYDIKVYDSSGTLINHFIPCYRKSDQVIGMYDEYNRAFKINIDSGSFTKGPDV